MLYLYLFQYSITNVSLKAKFVWKF